MLNHKDVLESILKDFNYNFLEVSEAYYSQGICLHCGNIQGCVEPDAEGYKCECCNRNSVTGFETALLRM